jgi:hypothetical protein
MEIESHGLSVGMGIRWLILLPWLVVGSRCKGFLVGRRLGAMIGGGLEMMKCNLGGKKAWRCARAPADRKLEACPFVRRGHASESNRV